MALLDAKADRSAEGGGKMADELIYRNALIAAYDAAHKGPPGGARKLMENAPAVDAAPVVRCKNCMYSYFAYNRVPDEQALVCERGGCSVTPDGFCAWGTPKTNCGPDYCEIGGDEH